jgi:hypothetical protein
MELHNASLLMYILLLSLRCMDVSIADDVSEYTSTRSGANVDGGEGEVVKNVSENCCSQAVTHPISHQAQCCLTLYQPNASLPTTPLGSGLRAAQQL